MQQKEWPLGPEVRSQRIPFEKHTSAPEGRVLQIVFVWAKAHTYPDEGFFRSL
jgi:hypothetical protein